MINGKQVDYKLFFAIFSLIIFWMIMISSVSVYSSFRVTNIMAKNGLIDNPYNYFYVIRNIIHVIVSFFVLILFVKVPYKFFEKNSVWFITFSIVGLIMVLLIWPSWNGARWWINLPFLPFAIQPTEFLKLSIVLFLSYYFKKNKNNLHTLDKWFLPFVWVLAFVILLIAMQPDFWSILVILPLSMIMYFIAGWNVRYIVVLVAIWSLLWLWVYSIWKYDKQDMETRNKFSYITDRIDNFLDKSSWNEGKVINYQTEQALIAIWSWWFSWVWFWSSVQKFWYLPEVQGDFIFSVVVEELWFLWAFVLVWLYLFIWYRWFFIAYYSRDMFARLYAIGISSWIMLQAFVNIWVNINILPLTGITLPFVSYWGSSLISLVIGVWILLNVSRDIDLSVDRFKKWSMFRRKNLFLINQ